LCGTFDLFHIFFCGTFDLFHDASLRIIYFVLFFVSVKYITL
jgi:hypothetical protein